MILGITVSLHIWGVAMATAPSFEFEVGWWERLHWVDFVSLLSDSLFTL
jgi:hypothetical protein